MASWILLGCRERAEDSATKSQATNETVVCAYTKVSSVFDFTIVDRKEAMTANSQKYLIIKRKNDTGAIQRITLNTDSLFSFSCESRSYVTRYNVNKEVHDGIYGDLIVADFNFDKKEDLAIAKDIGYTQFFDFYLQTNGLFVLDTFLSGNLIGLPETDSVHRWLITYSTFGALGLKTEHFILDLESNRYRKIKSEITNINTGDPYNPWDFSSN